MVQARPVFLESRIAEASSVKIQVVLAPRSSLRVLNLKTVPFLAQKYTLFGLYSPFRDWLGSCRTMMFPSTTIRPPALRTRRHHSMSSK